MGKRSLDIVAAGFGLLALFPLLAAIAIAVRLHQENAIFIFHHLELCGRCSIMSAFHAARCAALALHKKSGATQRAGDVPERELERSGWRVRRLRGHGWRRCAVPRSRAVRRASR